jgi:RNA polymerase sigma-70 factor, ECF subfamily
MSIRGYQPEHLFERTGLPQQAGSSLAMAAADEFLFIEQLRSGNEAAFVLLVDRYHSAMLRLAKVYVAAQAVAEEVVQETWMAVLESLHRFEGRSSLKTWMFRILTNRAKTRAQREGRSVPFSSLSDLDMYEAEPAVNPDRFLPLEHEWAGHWVSFLTN